MVADSISIFFVKMICTCKRLRWKKFLNTLLPRSTAPLSRQLRKGVKIQINDGAVFESATLFLGDAFVRVTQKIGEETRNTYYCWEKISCVTTIGKVED